MGFFARAGEQDDGQSEELARIEAGGIPAQAEARLKILGTGGSLFTTGLSVNEFALLDRLGPRPLAQVMGASVVRTGWQYLPALPAAKVVMTPAMQRGFGPSVTGLMLDSGYTEPSPAQVRNYQWHTSVVCQLDVLTDAWNLARRRALDRRLLAASHDRARARRIAGHECRRVRVARSLHADPAGPAAETKPGARRAESRVPRSPRGGAGQAAGAGIRQPRDGGGRGRVLPPRAPRQACAVVLADGKHAAGVAPRAFGDPLSRVGPQRRRAQGLGDHDARRGHGDPTRRPGVVVSGQDVDADEVEIDE